MLRLFTATADDWAALKEKAQTFNISSGHPAALEVKKDHITYWHKDGHLNGFWHAEIFYDLETKHVMLTRGMDKRARSEMESYHFLKALLKFSKKGVQGDRT